MLDSPTVLAMRMNESQNPIGTVESAASGRHGSSERVPQGRLLTAGCALASPCGAPGPQSSHTVYCRMVGSDTYRIIDGALDYEAPFHIMFALREQCRRKGVRFVRYRTEERRG